MAVSRILRLRLNSIRRRLTVGNFFPSQTPVCCPTIPNHKVRAFQSRAFFSNFQELIFKEAPKKKIMAFAECNFWGDARGRHQRKAFQWFFLSGQAAIVLGSYSMSCLAEGVSTESSSKTEKDILDKIAEDAMISNEHTSKWRIFTDRGRECFMQGNIEEAEKFFLSAIQEAKEGFGERDPHVASACNNLAELYRVKKDYANAEPLYVEAVAILEEYYGTNDIRLGAALHNLGQFYFVLRKLENARECYERAMKIKRRNLGEFHTEYADTMYHTAVVLHYQGKDNDSQELIAESIRILEESGLGNTPLCIRRMQYLAQMYTKSNKFAEAEALLRKILNVVESLKGWKSLDTVVAAERLAVAMQTSGELRKAEQLLERCLDARKSLLPSEHIQNAANELLIAKVKLLIAEQMQTTDSSQAKTELDMAKNLLHNSVRVAQKVLVQSMEKKRKKEAHTAMLILLQSLNALASLDAQQMESIGSKKPILEKPDAATAAHQCISTYKEYEGETLISESLQIKSEYLSCLKLIWDLMSKSIPTKEKGTEKDIQDEIQRIESELLSIRKA